MFLAFTYECTSIYVLQQKLRTLSWIYCSKNGLALRLSTGHSKNPCISFWCKSMVIRCVSPDLHIIFAKSFETMQPRFLILHCLLYGKYGITPTIDFADDVLQAYAIINSSIMLLFTSLQKHRCNACIDWIVINLLWTGLYNVNILATDGIADFHHSFTVCFMVNGTTARFHSQTVRNQVGEFGMWVTRN